ncbi:MAG: type IV secretion system DNA-binding domain-containing protein [Candidatus Pacebacteria bacterium]|jgi:type IV secretory pathway TraG/TraD family ATPase VirD4|nr:type IV secretion system DNA-binding domain-containing protein [Candidatus Paceibacterota bacterium]
MKNNISYFAETNGRKKVRFGIKSDDRLFHLYVIGKTGTGKTTLMETLAEQDIAHGHGVCVIDPHGDMAERLIARIPQERSDDLVYLDAADIDQPYGYNPLRQVRKDKVPLAVSGLMEALKKLFDDAWGVRMEHVLRNTLYALIEYGDATLPDILRMFSDTAYRHNVVKNISNVQVREFWEHEFKDYNPRYRQEMISPIQNKIGAFLADPRLFRILTNPPIDLSFRRIMDSGKILIVNLAKGRLGDDSANLLGALLVTTLNLAAFSRSELPEHSRRPFYLHLDEFQNFTTLSVANTVSELRKFKLGLVLANQHLHQLEGEVMHAVLGNVGTLIAFRVGAEDARTLAREFEPVFSPEDLVNIPNHDIYLKLMIDGAPSKPFSATTVRN